MSTPRPSSGHEAQAIDGVGLVCRAVAKQYLALSGGVTTALSNVSFALTPGEFVSIVGPSGCGKTTLLHLIAGLEPATSGTIEITGGIPPPRVGLVFQNHAVFPWRTVGGNLAYALESRQIDRAARRSEVLRLSRLVGLDPHRFLSRYPKELSGGEQRRVAIGMALSTEANLLLFDEPTSQLDYLARLQLGEMIQQLWLARRFTALLVTHDIDEAILLGDRVLILDEGRVTADLPVDLPRPRTPADFARDAFVQSRQAILQAFGAL